MSAREMVEEALTAALPEDWRLIPTQRSFDSIDSPTVLLKLQKFGSAKDAPLAAYEYTFVATLIEPGQDVEQVERSLDDHVEDLWQIIERVPQLLPTEAEKVAVGDAHLGYDLTFTALYAKES